MTRKMWPKDKYKDLVEELFDEGKLLINSSDIARQLGKELRRLEIRADVIIGHDRTCGKTVAVVIGYGTTRKRMLKI